VILTESLKPRSFVDRVVDDLIDEVVEPLRAGQTRCTSGAQRTGSEASRQ